MRPVTVREAPQVKLHEYQAKGCFSAAGIPVPRGEAVESAREARAAYTRLGGEVAVVKAQIHAGGRGKAGGVRLVRSAAEAQDFAATLLGQPLVTAQTGPGGTVVRRVLVEEGLGILKEYYAAVLVDRQREVPVVLASAEGGTEIEEVAAQRPEALLREPVDPARGLADFRARRIAFGLGVPRDLLRPFTQVLQRLARLFLDGDASLVEVNPLVTTQDGRVVCLDGKMTLDDNALFRHADLAALRDPGEEDATEVLAREAGLSYVKLDGDIGCLVNGAGLAMATMDIIKLHGGEPANFLDVGGSASAEQVKTAFEIILADPAVRAILVNIFGGIMRCDVVATGVVEATRQLRLKVPLVVRLHGTNVEQGRRILAESGLAIEPASDMAEAAARVVKAARGRDGSA